MLQARHNLVKTRIAAAACIFAASLIMSSATQVSAVPIPLPISVVRQNNGHATAVTVDNHTSQDIPAGQIGYPAQLGNSVTVSFEGVTKADGSPANTDVVPGDAGYLAAFCGNYSDTGNPATDLALTYSDISTLEGITTHCSALVPATSVSRGASAAPIISATLDLNLQGYQPAVAARPDTGVHGVAAVAAVVGVPDIPCVPATNVPATLFSRFIPACSISPAVPGTPAVAAVDAIPDTFVAGSPAIPAKQGTRCVATGNIIPCVIIIESADLSVSLSIPAVNTSDVSVLGRIGLYNPSTATGVCDPSSTVLPPSECPAARLSTPTAPYPVAIGGSNFIPNAASPALISAVQGGAATPTAGDNFTAVSEKLCSTADATNCVDAITDADPNAPVAIDTLGNLSGTLLVSGATISTGDKFVETTTVHYIATDSICPADYATVSTGICTLTHVHYSPIRILGDPVTPTFGPGSGAPGTIGTIFGSGYEPRANVSIQRRDSNGLDVGAALTTTTNGVGDLRFIFAAGALDYPVIDVVVTIVDAALGASTYSSGPIAFDVAAATAFCAATNSCNSATIVTTPVAPGNVQLFAGDAVADIPAVNLGTVDIQDRSTWYPLSAPGPMSQVVIGDLRGVNTGFVITGTVADLRGVTQPSNTIPARDVFVAAGSISCSPYAFAGEGTTPIGIISAGTSANPQLDIPGASPLATGTQVFCSLAPDASGVASGLFQLDASLQIAARPITASDDYTGTLVLTITGN